jgi:hypothetical protein
MGEQNGELKLVISLKGGKAQVGVQAPECDPVFFGLEGDLGAVLAGVPGFVEEAKRRWETSKLYPECESPLPSQAEPTPAVRASTTSRSRGRTTQGGPTPMF